MSISYLRAEFNLSVTAPTVPLNKQLIDFNIHVKSELNQQNNYKIK